MEFTITVEIPPWADFDPVENGWEIEAAAQEWVNEQYGAKDPYDEEKG